MRNTGIPQQSESQKTQNWSLQYNAKQVHMLHQIPAEKQQNSPKTHNKITSMTAQTSPTITYKLFPRDPPRKSGPKIH